MCDEQLRTLGLLSAAEDDGRSASVIEALVLKAIALSAAGAAPAALASLRRAVTLADDLDGTIAHARHALSVAPPEDPLVRAAAGALAGLALWSTGDLAGAYDAYTESVVGLTSAGFRADVLGCTITLGDILCTKGQLAAALRTYRQALELASSAPGAGPLRGTADMQIGIAGVLLERDDLAGANECLRISQQLGEPNGLPQNAYRWRVVSARLRAVECDLDGARYVNRLIAATTTIAASTRAAQPLVEPLSEREFEVLRLLGGDLGGPEIARHLSVSLNTVRTHIKSIYSKLGDQPPRRRPPGP